ncbi:MAG: hypothetical protein ABI881_00565 [Betaproteobacteria bacterium]
MADPPNRRMSQEPNAVDVRRVTIAAACLVAVVALCIVASVLLSRQFSRGNVQPHSLPDTGTVALEPAPGPELARFRAEKSAMLEGYRWIDRAHGVAHIPIDEAMRIVAQRHGAAGAAR